MLQFQAFITFVVGACGVIIAVGGAVAIIARLWAWIRKPTVDNSQTISEFEKYLASDKRRIENLEQDQEELKEQNRLMLRGIWILMKHMLDGNHTKQLAEVSDEIDKYLFQNING